MELITNQITEALYRLGLARPDSALWQGQAALALINELERLQSELCFLRDSLRLES